MSAAVEISGMDRLVRLCTPGSGPKPAAMLVLAHPDDESVGCASLLRGLTLAPFVYLTDGAPRDLQDAEAAGCATREEYAAMRRGELLSAMESIGVPAQRLELVETIDQEATRQLVPLTVWLEILMREHAPEIVLTHPYEGGHPDHDAAAFAVNVAQRRIRSAGDLAPVIAEFASYHLQDGDWGFGTFLPGADRHVLTRNLRAEEAALKRRLLGCYASQRQVLGRVPIDAERFRIAPEYDFTQPPHPGALLYERFGWEMSAEEWRQHAREALEALDGYPAPPAAECDPIGEAAPETSRAVPGSLAAHEQPR